MRNQIVKQASFESLKKNTQGLLNLEPPPPQIFETTKVEGGRVYHTLVLPVRREDGSERRIGIVTDYRSLLKLGRQIVQALDPSPDDQILAEMEAIRKLLEDQKRL